MGIALDLGQSAKRTIVHKRNKLHFIDIEGSNNALLLAISPLINQLNTGKSSVVFFAKLLHAYSDIFDDQLTELTIRSGHTPGFLGRFLKSVKDGILINVAPNTFETYLNFSRKCLIFLSSELSISDYHKKKRLIDIQIPFESAELPIMNDRKADYYRWWVIRSKSGTESFIDLTYVWENEGIDAARTVEKHINSVLGGYRKLNSYLPIFKEYFNYLSLDEELNYFDLKNDPAVSDKVWKGFCVHYFRRSLNSGNCLLTTKKRWNDSANSIYKALFEKGFFAAPLSDITYIHTGYKKGSETRISKSSQEDEIKVKESLITDVPLYLSDDEAIEAIVNDIEDDYKMCIKWAKEQFNDLWLRFSTNNHDFNFDDLELSNHDFRVKHRLNCWKKATRIDGSSYRLFSNKSQLASSFGMPTSYFEIPLSILLIKEHPEITESYLYNFELYDKFGHRTGYFKLDNNSYIKGYKLRKNSEKSEQTIKLNDVSIDIIEKLLAITSKAREYLKKKGDDNYRKLFINTNMAFSYPKPSSPHKASKESAYLNARLQQFRCLFPERDYDRIKKLNLNITLPKFRATCAVVDYFKNKDANLMSKKLGHDKYKPELLSHYLPEPVLKYFQSRWVRIFQKGIICEAMKDSRNLLKSSGFNNIKELERFLSIHAIKIEDSKYSSVDNSGDINSEGKVLIGINIEVLKVLLTIEKLGRNESELSINDNDYFLLSKIVIEDIERSDDSLLKSYLETAKVEINYDI